MKASVKTGVNRVNPEKLMLSKWTAVNPENRQKHYLVTALVRDVESAHVIACKIEAILTRKEREIDWRQLQDQSVWLMGWR